jgi:hypothetical protein
MIDLYTAETPNGWVPADCVPRASVEMRTVAYWFE